MKEITIDLNNVNPNQIYDLGYQYDHRTTKITFTNTEPGVAYKLLIDLKPQPCLISIVDNNWLISNTYTQEAGSFVAQIRKMVDGEWIAHTPLFQVIINDSVDMVEPLEEIPPRFEDRFNEMFNIVNECERKLKNGEFNGKSAYQIAVDNGFKGTEQEWLESLDYEHSQEFEDLANQVRTDSQQVSQDKVHVDTVVKEFDNVTTQANKNFTDKVTQANSLFDTKVLNANQGIDTKVNEFDTKVSEANTTIDTKVKQASDNAVQAQASADSVKASSEQIELNKIGINVLFNLHRTGKLYGVKIWKSAINPTSTCEKTRDNVGLVCEPSTDSNKGRDDYQDIPLFKWQRVNYKRYDDGFAYPIAFEGETNYNDKDNADVGNIYNTFYYNFIDNGDYEELVISDSPNKELGLKPFEEAVRVDGTVMPYFIMSTYHASLGSDGLLHSLPNKKCELFMSHDLMIDKFQKKGKGYWGAGLNRYTFGQIMMMIKYGTKDIQSIMQSCTNYSYQIKASIQDSNKQTYFPIPKADKSKFIVGSTVSVGYGSLSGGSISTNRNNTSMHKYADRCLIIKIEDLSDGLNAGIYIDCEPFDTMPVNLSGKQAEVTISTMPWHSGTTDKVIGHHDGSLGSNTDAKHSFRLQGIEYLVGAYTIASDTVMVFTADYSKDVYLAKRGVAHSKSETVIKNTYTKIGNIPASKNGQGSDYWVGDITHKDGAWYPSSELDSQLSYKDRLYAGNNYTSGTRAYLQGGYLGAGSLAGLTSLNCRLRLSGTNWSFTCADF